MDNFCIFENLAGNQKIRTIIFYKDYFADFFVKQRQKVKDKIVWTFDLIEIIERVPETYLKHLEGTDKLFEIRVQSGNDIFSPDSYRDVFSTRVIW